MGEYNRPQNMQALLDQLSSGGLKILAGGTDYYPAKVGKPLDEDILDITAVSSLAEISETAEAWRFGAAVSWSDIIAAKLPQLFDGLKAAAREVGGQQIQNSGTVGGNICNASPAADGVPALLSLGAEVEITNKNGARRVPLDEFILGNRRTILTPADLLTAFYIPKLPVDRSRGTFLKLGSRKYLVISLAMVAGTYEWDDNFRLKSCKIVVGACSEVAQRLRRLEEMLVGADLTADLAQNLDDVVFDQLSPIDDVRATADYRLQAAKTLTARMLQSWRQSDE